MIASPDEIEEAGRATWADRRFDDAVWHRAQELMKLEAESGRTIHREIWVGGDRISIRDADGQTLCYLQMEDGTGDETFMVTSKSVRVPRAALITLEMILRGYLH
ncbi:DNA/RNA endonuclease YhcR with UshA esterase domain [Skermanella aerolata]|uniref:hypothetical protein n=1 Tax=Skermanella aerolata TaxID=393310 RepID=UPI003D20012A